LERRISDVSCVVCRAAASSSLEGFGGLVGLAGGVEGVEGVEAVDEVLRAARAASSTVLVFTRVSSVKERMSSAWVARRVLKGKLRFRGSLLRRICPSYGPNSVRRFVLPVARMNRSSAVSIMLFHSLSNSRTSLVSAASLYRRSDEPAECAAPFEASLADCEPPCFRRVVYL